MNWLILFYLLQEASKDFNIAVHSDDENKGFGLVEIDCDPALESRAFEWLLRKNAKKKECAPVCQYATASCHEIALLTTACWLILSQGLLVYSWSSGPVMTYAMELTPEGAGGRIFEVAMDVTKSK